MKRDDGPAFFIALIERLLSLQLAMQHEHVRKTFPALMTNRVAAGYVFGFHDSCFQMFGLARPNDHALFESSYQHIFGEQAGFVLLNSSLSWQTDREFGIGRQSGGEDFAQFKLDDTPPFGLQRIICLRFNAAMVEAGLDNPERASATPTPLSPKRDDATRVGRRGICMLCGTIKSGSYVPCEECGFQPISDEEVAVSLMLNETSVKNFTQIAQAIKSGQIPEYNEKDIEKLVGTTAAETRRMLGLEQARYFTRAKTESLLTYSVQVAAQVMSKTIAKSVPGELKELSNERMLAVLAGMIKGELIRRAPMSERQFIQQFFGKRLALMSMQSDFPSRTGTSKSEFAQRVAQAIFDFETKAFDVTGDKHTLEKAIISFVLPNMDAVRAYVMQSHGYPHVGNYLLIQAALYAERMNEYAADWK